MKTVRHKFEFLKSGNKQNKTAKQISLFLLLLLLLGNKSAIAQNAASEIPINDLLAYWFWGGFAVIFIGSVIYVFSRAINVLHENGRTIEFNFPIIRKMANNEKTVAIMIALLVLAGIIYAVKFGA
ncbi:MAG: hypothetical protein HYU69_12695 [Bacteroidetes bacterium]|nr:hypothetical protein [Bacteroidota bacterium]